MDLKAYPYFCKKQGYMQRIETLLQKVMDMSARGSKNTAIDIDLMMDYIKVVYADLMEMRARAVYTSDMPQTAPPVEQVAPEPVKTSSVISTITPEAMSVPEPGSYCCSRSCCCRRTNYSGNTHCCRGRA